MPIARIGHWARPQWQRLKRRYGSAILNSCSRPARLAFLCLSCFLSKFERRLGQQQIRTERCRIAPDLFFGIGRGKSRAPERQYQLDFESFASALTKLFLALVSTASLSFTDSPAAGGVSCASPVHPVHFLPVTAERGKIQYDHDKSEKIESHCQSDGDMHRQNANQPKETSLFHPNENWITHFDQADRNSEDWQKVSESNKNIR